MLDMARRIWSAIPPGDLEQLTADQPSEMHGVTFAELSKLGALLYMYTGDTKQRDVSVEAMRRVLKYHMLPDGTPSTTEQLRGTSVLDGHETCDIIEFNIFGSYLLMATGSGAYGDHIERALFNAGMGAIRKDWSGLQYISCPNQLRIARNSCQVGHLGTAASLYGPNSDLRPKYPFVTACCAGNVSRMLPSYVQCMWMNAPDQGLAAVLYGPSRVTAVAGREQRVFEIVQETSYPFAETISFRIRSDGPAEFPLYLRAPGWCDSPALQINGKRQPLPHQENGFLVLHRIHRNGDVIDLELPMKMASGRSSDGGIFLERGPLVYSLKPEELWTSIAMPELEITSPEFPMWAATAGSPWNFALSLDESTPLEEQVAVRRTQPSGDLWSKPPISIEVRGRELPEWKLVHPEGKAASWGRTPPLAAESSPAGPEQDLRMVPLGSTGLRLTVFPNRPVEQRKA